MKQNDLNNKTDVGVSGLLLKLGLSEDFLNELMDESDWSFIIKLHALIEAVTTSLLVFHFNDKRLTKVFSRLDLSNKTIGKITILKELELIDYYDSKYIQNLSELRNSLVHDVQNHNFSLEDWVKTLNKEQLKNFAISMRPYEGIVQNMKKMPGGLLWNNLSESLKKQSETSTLIDFALNSPKHHIWLGAKSLLVSYVNSLYYSDYLQSIKAEDIFVDNRKIFDN